VLPDKEGLFERRGNDIFMELPLAYHQAALGDEVEIPTLDGKTTVDIPGGTQPGKIITLKGKGVPILGTDGRRRGDLHVVVTIAVPQKVSAEEAKLLKELASLNNSNDSKKSKAHAGAGNDNS